MSFVKHSIDQVNSDQEEYFYHVEQARQFLEYAEQAKQDLEHAMKHLRRHNCWLEEYSNKNFIA